MLLLNAVILMGDFRIENALAGGGSLSLKTLSALEFGNLTRCVLHAIPGVPLLLIQLMTQRPQPPSRGHEDYGASGLP